MNCKTANPFPVKPVAFLKAQLYLKIYKKKKNQLAHTTI